MKISPETKRKLTRFKITIPNYTSWKLQLGNKGFSEEESDEIILQTYPEQPIKNILKYYDQLKLLLSNQEIVIIASSDNAPNNIRVLLNLAKMGALDNCGFTSTQILNLIAKGGSEAIVSALKHKKALLMYGFDINQIYSIGAHLNGNLNIEIVANTDSHEWFALLKMNPDDIVKIVGRDDGHKNLLNYFSYREAQTIQQIEQEKQLLSKDFLLAPPEEELDWLTYFDDMSAKYQAEKIDEDVAWVNNVLLDEKDFQLAPTTPNQKTSLIDNNQNSKPQNKLTQYPGILFSSSGSKRRKNNDEKLFALIVSGEDNEEMDLTWPDWQHVISVPEFRPSPEEVASYEQFTAKAEWTSFFQSDDEQTQYTEGHNILALCGNSKQLR